MMELLKLFWDNPQLILTLFISIIISPIGIFVVFVVVFAIWGLGKLRPYFSNKKSRYNLKGVGRMTTAMFLFVGLFGIWKGGCETQEQKVEKLIKQLRDQNVDVRRDAVFALGKIGAEAKDAVPTLIELLQGQEWWIRMNAAEALGKIGSEDAVHALTQALQDQNEWVRANAAGALGEIGTPEAIKAAKGAIPDLIQLLQDQNGYVRGDAAVEDLMVSIVFALEKIGTPEALKAVEEYQSR